MRNEITWSPQQTAFLDFVEHGTGSCVLEAVAGAGKSTTIVEAATAPKAQACRNGNRSRKGT
jgi:hypothetical protein